ncbi:MAG: sugar phosphate isomerase/epimerase family protein [Planctomycetota bacterium]|nr:sugar phosphate isomerase/epimerase family protein [Planctomycetota bacterium]
MTGQLILSAAPPFRTDDPYRDMASRLNAMGYSGVMMGWSRDWSDEYIKEIRSIFEDAGIGIHEVGAYCNLAHRDENVRRNNVDDARAAIAVAEKLSCSNVASVVGSPAAVQDIHWALEPETYSQRTWDLIRKILAEIVSFTEGTNVKFLIEPYMLTCMNSPQAIRKMIEEVGHPNLGVLMDVVNLIRFEHYLDTGAFIDECFDVLGDFIHLCHAKDILCDPHNDLLTFKEVTPGDGVMDYGSFIRNIVGLDRPVPLMVEHLAEDSELVRAHNYICEQAGAVGVKVLS